MTASERGFLLLCCDIGDGMTPLSLHQLELLRRRMQNGKPFEDATLQITSSVLQQLGYSEKSANRITALLDREKELDNYLAIGAERGCLPLSCVSNGFPQQLRVRLGRRCPAVLFYRGNLSLLETRRVSLAGSRQLKEPGRDFAVRIGELAAQEGYTLVSGNAAGADKTAQETCRIYGGNVIAVVSEPMCELPAPDEHLLYLSESGWHQPFSPARALSRNRLIYALGEKSFVAQCAPGSGTMQGAEDALRHGISAVFVHDDGSKGTKSLTAFGAVPLRLSALESLTSALPAQTAFFDV